jgi:hypothetical protein
MITQKQRFARGLAAGWFLSVVGVVTATVNSPFPVSTFIEVALVCIAVMVTFTVAFRHIQR